MTPKVKVGIIGTGMISNAYIKGCQQSSILDLVACSDIYLDKARAMAEQYAIPHVYTVEELLADPDIQIVINLTIPKAHAPVAISAIEAGKHVYSEKPFAVTVEEGRRVLELARARGVLVGNSPETFLGISHQLCRKLIDEGVIGEPIAALASLAGRVDPGDPARDFMFQPGGGPMLDMGPYYFTDLVNMLGPIRRVTGQVRNTFPERTITYRGSERQLSVTIPTHLTGALDFVGGAVATVLMSFDMPGGHDIPRLQIYGSEGILDVPDPNLHGGPVRIRLHGKDWEEVAHPYKEGYFRGVGVEDLAYAIHEGRQPLASGELAEHVLEAMLAFEQSSSTGRHIDIQSRPQIPPLLPADRIWNF